MVFLIFLFFVFKYLYILKARDNNLRRKKIKIFKCIKMKWAYALIKKMISGVRKILFPFQLSFLPHISINFLENKTQYIKHFVLLLCKCVDFLLGFYWKSRQILNKKIIFAVCNSQSWSWFIHLDTRSVCELFLLEMIFWQRLHDLPVVL